MPAGVWARSVSASEIEVNWQALSFTPERVLGYEVHFTLLNGNRNHTQHNSNACHPRCTSKPSLPNSALPWKLLQLADCYSQNCTVLCTNTTGKHVRLFSREQKKIACPHAFLLWGIMIQCLMIVCATILHQTACQNTKKCLHTSPDVMLFINLSIKSFYSLTAAHQESIDLSLFSK